MKYIITFSLLFVISCVGNIEGQVPNQTQIDAEIDSLTPATALLLDPKCVQYQSAFSSGISPRSFPVNVVVDSSIDDTNVGYILDAIDFWNANMKYEVLYASITDNLRMHNACNYTILTEMTVLPAPYVGFTSYGECANDTVAIETMETGSESVDVSFFTDKNVTQIIEHELGHVLGLDHEQENTSIMYPSIETTAINVSQKSYCIVQYAIYETKAKGARW